jgi:hypothetical protein
MCDGMSWALLFTDEATFQVSGNMNTAYGNTITGFKYIPTETPNEKWKNWSPIMKSAVAAGGREGRVAPL